MKLCQKCKDDIANFDDFDRTADIPTSPEFECEFWAHKELNLLKHSIVSGLTEDLS